jgi:hypothetical protein
MEAVLGQAVFLEENAVVHPFVGHGYQRQPKKGLLAPHKKRVPGSEERKGG